MANEMFYIKVETPQNATVYAFTRSVTGILDYAGTASATEYDFSNMQCVDGGDLAAAVSHGSAPIARRCLLSGRVPDARG